MASAFDAFRTLGPAAFVLKAMVAAAVANALLLGFMLLRRSYRKRYFARRDAKVFEIRQDWDELISGEIPYRSWRSKPFDREIIEMMALDAFEVCGSQQSARLLKFLRTSGLIEAKILEVRSRRGWTRHRALVALGRTRAPEAIPALAEALHDSRLETRLAALRGLERMASPEAANAILDWVAEQGLQVPALPLQMALLRCCAERPQVLLPYLQHTEKLTREVLARVLGEVATASMSADLLPLVDDDVPEVRAAVARALSVVEPDVTIELLNELAEDPVWFVRLRAVVSLGKLRDQRTVPALMHGLSDSNRLVRLRSAEALVDVKSNMVAIFDKVVAAGDRYGLYAYIAALDKARLQGKLKAALGSAGELKKERRELLLEVLRTGSLPAEQVDEVKTLVATASY